MRRGELSVVSCQFSVGRCQRWVIECQVLGLRSQPRYIIPIRATGDVGLKLFVIMSEAKDLLFAPRSKHLPSLRESQLLTIASQRWAILRCPALRGRELRTAGIHAIRKHLELGPDLTRNSYFLSDN